MESITLDRHSLEIAKEASEALGISISDFVNQSVKFAATANAIYYEHPRTELNVFGPKKFPSLTKLEFYSWVPYWEPARDSQIYCGPYRGASANESNEKA